VNKKDQQIESEEELEPIKYIDVNRGNIIHQDL
jgi:hypothetical protein